MAYSYIEAIGLGFPGVECHAFGDGSVYDEIIWDGGLPLPSMQTLDEWISANNSNLLQKKITVYAMRQRFTVPEKIAIEYSSADKHDDTIEGRQFSALLRVMLSDLATASFVDLGNPSVIDMVNLLEQRGLIGTGRAVEILNNPIQSHELI